MQAFVMMRCNIHDADIGGVERVPRARLLSTVNGTRTADTYLVTAPRVKYAIRFFLPPRRPVTLAHSEAPRASFFPSPLLAGRPYSFSNVAFSYARVGLNEATTEANSPQLWQNSNFNIHPTLFMIREL